MKDTKEIHKKKMILLDKLLNLSNKVIKFVAFEYLKKIFFLTIFNEYYFMQISCSQFLWESKSLLGIEVWGEAVYI